MPCLLALAISALPCSQNNNSSNNNNNNKPSFSQFVSLRSHEKRVSNNFSLCPPKEFKKFKLLGPPLPLLGDAAIHMSVWWTVNEASTTGALNMVWIFT